MTLVTEDVWDVRQQDFPATLPIEVQLRFLLRYAILAPSSKNTQPWRFAVEGNAVSIYADRSRAQPIADPSERELYVSLGCALENLLVAGEHFGFRCVVSYLPLPDHPDLACTVVLEAGGTRSPSQAAIPLDTILRRCTDHGVYREAPVTPADRARLEACDTEAGLRLALTDEPAIRRRMDELTLQADVRLFADPEFRDELGYWVGQGVFGTPWLISQLGRLAMSHLDLGKPAAKRDRKVLDSAALLGLVSSAKDDHLAHLRTGQLLEWLWLTATAMGLSVHPMSQTMELADLRAEVAALLPGGGWIPQQPFRVGHSAAQRPHHSPRRPLEEVVRD